MKIIKIFKGEPNNKIELTEEEFLKDKGIDGFWGSPEQALHALKETGTLVFMFSIFKYKEQPK